MWKMSDSTHCQMPVSLAIQGIIGKTHVRVNRGFITPYDCVTGLGS
jgi:hypothetical protein